MFYSNIVVPNNNYLKENDGTDVRGREKDVAYFSLHEGSSHMLKDLFLLPVLDN